MGLPTFIINSKPLKKNVKEGKKKKKDRKKKPQVSQVFSMVEEKGNQITYIHVALNPKL